MIIDTAQGILDLRFWIAETANSLRLTADSLRPTARRWSMTSQTRYSWPKVERKVSG